MTRAQSASAPARRTNDIEPGSLEVALDGDRAGLPAGGAGPARHEHALEGAAVDAHRQAGAEAAGREAAVGPQRADPELGVAALGGRGAERALGVLERHAPAGGDERGAVPQLPAPALPEPVAGQRVQG